jgi:hypothetical protein
MIAAVEDPLSEAMVRKIVAEVRPDLTLYQVMRKNGHGYIRSKVRELNQTARKVPVFVLVDLDRPAPCPADLIREFLPIPPAPKLLFRVAVMEVESWVMADRARFASFLGVAEDIVPADPDSVPRPKELIVSLARKSKRKDIRVDLAPAPGDTRIVGPAYNPRLTAFVRNAWQMKTAALASPSLSKAVERLRAAF